ncbi:hypothetical protein BHE74_00002927 [Ensete ventricosum]|nr:hypothetical protein BHE74_00002927 [Ensete ventricosum]
MLVPRPKLGVWKVSKNTVDHEATAREAHGTKEGLGANGSRAKSPRCKEHINHHYTMALIDRVHDMSRVISCLGDKITDLLSEFQEMKEGPDLVVVAAVERRVADL